MTLSSAFAPIGPNRMAEDASLLTAMRIAIRNPLEMWSNRMYREFAIETKFLGERIIHVSDPAIMQDILLTHQDIFPKSEIEQLVLERATGLGLLTATGTQWKIQRRATSPVFRHANLMGLAPVMIDAGRDAADRMAATPGVVDVMPYMTGATLKIISATLLSGEEDRMDFDRIAEDVEILLDNLGKIDVLDFFKPLRKLPKPWARKGQNAVKRLRDDAMSVIQYRRTSGKSTDDLLSFLMAARDPDTGKALTDIELRDNIITFIGAGHETTSLALTWALYLLANAPDWQDRLFAEIQEVCGNGPLLPEHIDKLVQHDMVIRETMRLFPPAPAMDRVATADVKIGDLEIKAGDIFVLAIYPMHHHEKLWDRPEVFNPNRFAPGTEQTRHRYQYIPFSGGPRICIGMRFAMMEAVAVLAEVIRKVRLSDPGTHRPYPKSRITLRPTGGMHLTVTPR